MRDLNKKGLRILVIQLFRQFEGAATVNLTKDSAQGKGSESMDSRARVATVLLVEDTEDNRQMMRRLLELSGFKVVEATNGKEAVELAAEVEPDVILMDLSLPLVDGLAATRRIRQLPGLERVPIIAVSAHDTADFHSEALAAGCDAYITKPIDYSELEEVVDRLIRS